MNDEQRRILFAIAGLALAAGAAYCIDQADVTHAVVIDVKPIVRSIPVSVKA